MQPIKKKLNNVQNASVALIVALMNSNKLVAELIAAIDNPYDGSVHDAITNLGISFGTVADCMENYYASTEFLLGMGGVIDE